MRYPNLRYGKIEEFIAYTEGRTRDEIARDVRRCERTIRNWLAQRIRIPYWAVERVRLLWEARHSCPVKPDRRACRDDLPPRYQPSDKSNFDAPTATPVASSPVETTTVSTATRDELTAWVGVMSPHYLSSDRAFENYVRGWRVPEKILNAKAKGTFEAVLSAWAFIRTRPITERVGLSALISGSAWT